MRAFVLAVTFVLGGNGASAAPMLDFSQGPQGSIGTQVQVGPVTVRAQETPSVWWHEPNLYRRNVPDDHGFGVCSEVDWPCVLGDDNEIDNWGGRLEQIRMDLDPGWTWERVWLSSLDNGERSQLGSPVNGWMVWWGNAQAGVGNFGSTVESWVDVPAQYQGIRTLIVRAPNDPWRNNDHLVWGVDVRAPEVPEPGTLSLLGLGLCGGAGWLRRRRHSRSSR